MGTGADLRRHPCLVVVVSVDLPSAAVGLAIGIPFGCAMTLGILLVMLGKADRNDLNLTLGVITSSLRRIEDTLHRIAAQ